MARRFSDSSTESRRKESPSIRRRFLLSSSFIRWRYKKMLCRVLKLNNCKRKKLFFFLLRFRPWCTRGNAGVVDRPTRKSSDRSLSLHDPILIYLSWAKCRPQTIGSWKIHPHLSFPVYYITSLSLMKFNQKRFCKQHFVCGHAATAIY